MGYGKKPIKRERNKKINKLSLKETIEKLETHREQRDSKFYKDLESHRNELMKDKLYI